MPQAVPIPTFDRHGASMPLLGFGTWRLTGDQCRASVEHALACGYRHIDTAAMYGNEEAVGAALASAGIARESVFVTTKVWHDRLHRDDLIHSAEDSLARLDCGYLDLLLVHWPNPAVPLAETMAALDELRARGVARNIGVSNFTPSLMAEAAALAVAPIFCNQSEYGLGLNQSTLIAACREQDAVFVAYRSLDRGDRSTEQVVRGIAEAHERTPSQVVLRWLLQQEVAAIPRSANPAHIAENFAVTDFVLSEAEMNTLFALAARTDPR